MKLCVPSPEAFWALLCMQDKTPPRGASWMATELHNRQICLAVFFTLNSGGEASCPCTLPSVVPPSPPFCSFMSFALGWLQLLDWEPQELPAKTQWIVQAFRLPWYKVCSVSAPLSPECGEGLQCAVLILFPQLLTGAIWKWVRACDF